MVKLINSIMRLVEKLLIIMLGISVAIIAAQVIWRYVLNSPLGWTEQMARSVFIWMVMLGIPVMFNRNITMSFDVILERITGKAHEIIQICLRVLGMAFSVFYFSAAVQLMVNTGGRMTAGIKMPYNLLYGAQAVCAFLLFFVLLKQTIEKIRAMKPEEQGGDEL